MLGSAVGDRIEDAAVRAPARVTDLRAEAFRRLVDSKLDAAYRLAAVILDDRVEAEDAVHDAALAAWRRWGDLRDPARFEAWFSRILVNGCRDRLRARGRRRVMDIGRELLAAEHPVEGDSAEPLATRDELDGALEALSPEERIVVVLRFYRDLPVAAIAALVAIPEGTVKSRLHHALRRLRTAMAEADR